MTAITNLPDLRPSLLLDFANSGRVDPRIQCTRGSSATCFGPDGKLRTVAANVPRIDHDPMTGKCLGLLSESQRSNLLTNSLALSGYSQGPNGTYSAGRIGIDGITPSMRVMANALGNVFLAKTVSVAAGPYTESVYFCADVKPTAGSLLRMEEMQADGSKAIKTLNFTNASVIADGKWRRYELTVTHAAAGTVNVYFAVDPSVGQAIDVCAAQYEAGAFPTSYIPTEASAVTRAGDSLYMEGPTLSSWYRPDEGSFVIENAVAGLVPFLAYMPRFNNLGNADKYMAVRYGQVIGGADFFVSDPTPQVDSTEYAVTANTPSKFGVAYKVNDFASVRGGGTVTTHTTGTVPTITRFELSAAQTGTIRRFAYYPKRISNDQLKRLTA